MTSVVVAHWTAFRETQCCKVSNEIQNHFEGTSCKCVRKFCVASMNWRILSRPCVVSASRCTCFALHSFCAETKTRPPVGVLGRHPSVLEAFAGRRQMFFPLSHYPCFPRPLAVGHSIVLEHTMTISVVSVADADCSLLGDREGKPSRVCLVVQRPVHSRSVRSQHPEESTLSLVLSLRVDRNLWRVSHATHAPSVFFFPCPCQIERWLLRVCSCMTQVNKRLQFCRGVPCKSALFVSSLHTYTISSAVCSSSCSYVLILQYQNPQRYHWTLSTILMNNDAHPFAELNTNKPQTHY